MADDGFLRSVTEVLALVRAHSEKVDSRKRRSSVVERWSNRVAGAGGCLLLLAIAAQVIWVSDGRTMDWPTVMFIVAVLAMLSGLLATAINSIRTTKRPFPEHIDRILDALPGEIDLLDELQRFEVTVLEFSRRRLKLQSTKVAARLDMVGGGEGLRASWIGIAVLGFALISQYEPFGAGTTFTTTVTLLGLALLFGLSVGGLFVRYGASQSDYYCEIIGLAIERKAQVERVEASDISVRAGQAAGSVGRWGEIRRAVRAVRWRR